MCMRVTTGTVKGGRIEAPGESFAEGLTVTIIAPEGDETFELGEEDEERLLAAIEESARGNVISADDFLRELDSEV